MVRSEIAAQLSADGFELREDATVTAVDSTVDTAWGTLTVRQVICDAGIAVVVWRRGWPSPSAATGWCRGMAAAGRPRRPERCARSGSSAGGWRIPAG